MPRRRRSDSTPSRARALCVAIAIAIACAAMRTVEALNTFEWMTLVRHDVYGELGVSKDANITTINKAYRKLALKHHPDKLPKTLPPAEKKRLTDAFKVIAHAKKVLSDETSRAEYDDAIANLPKWARPKVGKKSIFDKKEVKFPALLVLVMFVVFCVAFTSFAQYTSRAHDKQSLMESPMFAQSLKKRNKNLPKPRQVSAEEFFQEFLEENGVTDLCGWEHTVGARVLTYVKDFALGRLYARDSMATLNDAAGDGVENFETSESGMSASEATANGSVGDEDEAQSSGAGGKASGKKRKGKKRRDAAANGSSSAAAEAERKRAENERRLKFEEDSKRARVLKRRRVRLEMILSGAFVVNEIYAEELTVAGLTFDGDNVEDFVMRAKDQGEVFDAAMDAAEARVKQIRLEKEARERELLERAERDKEKNAGEGDVDSDSEQIVRIGRTSSD